MLVISGVIGSPHTFGICKMQYHTKSVNMLMLQFCTFRRHFCSSSVKTLKLASNCPMRVDRPDPANPTKAKEGALHRVRRALSSANAFGLSKTNERFSWTFSAFVSILMVF
jgi:hypothetical protein